MSAPSSFDTLLSRHQLLPGRRIAWALCGFLAVFLLWSAFAQLDEVAVAEGEVIPQGQVKVIQHLEGGIVKNMRYVTIGGVVQAGAPIMEIVPTDEKLQIDVRLKPKDRGYVRVGQKALVKISSYDYARHGDLDGIVTEVAPDASTDKSGQPYFQVIVETAQTRLGSGPGAFPISPGIQATADIHTGTRSVLDYLIRPVLKLKHEAFRER